MINSMAQLLQFNDTCGIVAAIFVTALGIITIQAIFFQGNK